MVDDASENIDLLVGLLKEKYSVKAARTGKIALKIAGAVNSPGLILLDIVMPIMDGFEVCKKLKEDPKTTYIPVIFLSGEVGQAERDKGAELGAIDYLTNPVDPNKLMAAIDAALIEK